MDYYLLILIICTEGRGSLVYIFYVIMICKKPTGHVKFNAVKFS